MRSLTLGLGLALQLMSLAVQPVAATGPHASATTASEGVWQGITWTDLGGNRWSAEELHGRVVLLDFWATWCLPCLAQVPHLREISERFDEQDVVVLGVALDSKQRRPLRSFLARHRIQWPQVHQPLAFASDAALHFDVDKVPTSIVVDRQGRPVARDLTGSALDATLQMLVALDLP